jgi:hypothetical protein
VPWSDSLFFALGCVAEPYSLLNMDELILSATLDHEAVTAVVSQFVESDGNYLRLNPTPHGNATPGAVGLVPPGDVYRSSTVFLIKGKVDPRALVALNRCGISYEPSRSLMSGLALTKRRLQEKPSLVLSRPPSGLARSMRSTFLLR